MGRKNTRKMKSDDDDESYDPRDEPKRTYNRLKEAKKTAIYKAFDDGLKNKKVSETLKVGQSNVKAYRSKHQKILRESHETNEITPVKIKKEHTTEQFESSLSTERNEAQSTQTVGSFEIIRTRQHQGMLVYEINPQSKLAQHLLTQAGNCEWCKNGLTKSCPSHLMI